MTAVRLGPGGEFDLIRRMTTSLDPGPSGRVRVGAGDDAAVLADGTVLTCDLAVEGVHFRREWLTHHELGRRAVQASLSDLAAMAAEPLAVLVSYALPEELPPEAAVELQGGADEGCRRCGATLVGGDLVASAGGLVVDVVAVGRTARPRLRSGARVGDEVWVTGRLGGAAAAVSLLLDERSPPEDLHRAWAEPRARTEEARWLADRLDVRALIDLSDGLAGDASHVAAASEVTVVLETDRIPVSPAAVGVFGEDEALHLALSGGEDYELCLTAAPGETAEWVEEFETAFGLGLTRVGRVEVAGPEGVLLAAPDGSRRPPEWGGFDHFDLP